MSMETDQINESQPQSRRTDDKLINGLGWFSIGLGLGEVLAPGSVARLIGVPDEPRARNVLRTYGVREIAAGIGILSQPRTPAWMWSRVAGDLMDLATLGSALASRDADRSRVAAATAAVLGVTAVDVFCGRKLSNSGSIQTGPTRVAKAITIGRPPEELYRFWRDLGNMPKFMDGVESVQTLGADRSHWTIRLPGGKSVEWDAEIVEEQPDRMISWRATGDAGDHFGSVRFEPAPGGRGTVVSVELRHTPLNGGVIGSLMSKLSGPGFGVILENDLRRFKQIMETGEIVRSDASIHRGMHPAQPPVSYPEPATAL